MPMDVMSRDSRLLSSNLNPNAPMFVPAAYRNVEDFSDQWWSLIQSSSWFRDYWLRECYSEPQFDFNWSESSDPPDDDSLLFDGKISGSEGEEKEVRKDLIRLGTLNWRKARSVKSPRLYEKAPKIVNAKVNPRPIHQPR